PTEARPHKPDPLLQGPRRRRRRREGGGAGNRHARVRVDGQPRQRGRRPRCGARHALRGAVPDDRRAGETARDRGLRRRARRGPRLLRRVQQARRRARVRARLGVRERKPASLLRGRVADARVRGARRRRSRGRDGRRLRRRDPFGAGRRGRQQHGAARAGERNLRRDGRRGRARRSARCRRLRPRRQQRSRRPRRHGHGAEDTGRGRRQRRGRDRAGRRVAARRARGRRVSATIACLPGDGIGPEVTAEALRALTALPLEVSVIELPFGGAAIDVTGEPLPADTLAACRAADAVLLGAVGGPRWDGGGPRPEAGLLELRSALDVYANLRPAAYGDVDLVVVRELVGGLYFGPRGIRDDGTAYDTCEYHPAQVERVVRRAFELAAARRRELVSVDKANVLETSRLWRRVVNDVAADFPEVELRHALVDSFAIEVALRPGSLDVVVTENMFGDILSDLACGVAGGLGLAASASLGDGPPGIFEP